MRRLHRVTLVDLLHDPLSPPDRIGNGTDRRGNPRPAVVLRKLASREDRGSDEKNSFSSFVHQESLAPSSFVRHCGVGARDRGNSVGVWGN